MTQSLTSELTEPQPAELPSNLSTLIGERALFALARQAVDAVDARLPRWQRDPGGDAGPRTLLALLTYCYAAGTYASEDIEWACRHEEAARYVGGNMCPDQDRLRRFRRANRPWIEQCLAWVLERVREQLHPTVGPLESRGAEPGNSSDLAFLQLARRRVTLATLMDSALAD
jgi:hypothetical protein